MYKNIYHDIRVENLTRVKESGYRSWSALFKKISKQDTYLYEVLNGKRTFIEDLARTLEYELGLPPGELDKSSKRSDNMRMVKIYSPVLSAGDGKDILNEEEIGLFPLPAQLIQERQLNTEKLACLRVKGDSMQPHISDGGYVIIDTTKKEIVNNKIYAFSYDNVIRVKRLFQSLSGIIIKSDNPSYPEEKLNFKEFSEDSNNFSISGRVEIIINTDI